MRFRWRSQDHRKACIAKMSTLVTCRGMDWNKAAEIALHMHHEGKFWYSHHPELAEESVIEQLVKDGKKLLKRKGA